MQACARCDVCFEQRALARSENNFTNNLTPQFDFQRGGGVGGRGGWKGARPKRVQCIRVEGKKAEAGARGEGKRGE